MPHRAWVDVVDTVTGWVDGSTSDPMEVAGRIVEGVYNELGLRYDRDRGASFYTDYPGTWAGASFDASWFQDRAFGSIINCSDAASIVSAYANMMGVDLRQVDPVQFRRLLPRPQPLRQVRQAVEAR